MSWSGLPKIETSGVKMDFSSCHSVLSLNTLEARFPTILSTPGI